MRANDARAAIYAGIIALAIGILSILSLPAYAQALAGTSWQLVQFQSSEGTSRKPDDKTKYTVTFGTDNRVSVRFDCNRGSGTWSSPGPNQLRFGSMAMTQAACLTLGSLHDRIARDWANVRSYVLKDGHLFLSLIADGGTYEFEPMSKAAQ
jgi:para-nitrobenzyl esterase